MYLWIMGIMTVILIVVVIGVLIYLVVKPKVTVVLPHSYMEVKGKDVTGYDISYNPNLAGNIQALERLCNTTSECIGFNTGGYLKRAAPILSPSSYNFYYRNR